MLFSGSYEKYIQYHEGIFIGNDVGKFYSNFIFIMASCLILNIFFIQNG